jgi:hypothetical protein
VYQTQQDEADEAAQAFSRSYKLADGRALDPLTNEIQDRPDREKIYRV